MIMSSSQKNITNWALTHALWFVCVLGGNNWAIITGLVYWLIYAVWIGELKQEWRAILIITITGYAIDMLLSWCGVIKFNSILPTPLWLLVLWSGFATLFYHGLSWLNSKPIMAAALGAIAGPAAYFAGISLSNSTLNVSLPIFISIYAVIWSLYIPLFLLIAGYFAKSPSPVEIHS